MNCPRCSGLIVTQYDETRCLQCGWYDNPPYAESIRDAYDKICCRNCKRKPVKGKSLCQSCLDYQVDYRKKQALA
jgi:hypothetical protein